MTSAKEQTEENKETSSGNGAPSGEKWGYDLYPERRGGRHSTDWFRAFFMLEGRDNMQKIRCEKNVYNCVRTSPLVKIMMGALKSSGCEINIRRHIVCEFCDESVSGGYDPELNQIVVCQNTSKTEGIVQGVLTHEMIHMFDFCRHNLDFKNIDHLACTEIRAANLTHCSFLSAVTRGDASFWNVKARQQECVKNKAVHSVMSVRKITYEEAREAVDRTFPKCYPDMEPIGRRLRPRSNDMFKAYYEAPIYECDVLLLANPQCNWNFLAYSYPSTLDLSESLRSETRRKHLRGSLEKLPELGSIGPSNDSSGKEISTLINRVSGFTAYRLANSRCWSRCVLSFP